MSPLRSDTVSLHCQWQRPIYTFMPELRCMPCINKHHYSFKGQTEISGNAHSCIFKYLCATGGFKSRSCSHSGPFARTRFQCLFVCTFVRTHVRMYVCGVPKSEDESRGHVVALVVRFALGSQLWPTTGGKRLKKDLRNHPGPRV